MEGGNQHQDEATESEKHNAGMEAPRSMKIEKEPGDEDLKEQAHDQKTNRLQPA